MMPGILSFSVPTGISHVCPGNQGGGVRLLQHAADNEFRGLFRIETMRH